jgi:hypothetical protein
MANQHNPYSVHSSLEHLIGRVRRQHLASFDEIVQEGELARELAQLLALAEGAIAARWHGRRFAQWWRRAPKRGPRIFRPGSHYYYPNNNNNHGNELYLRAMLQSAREWHAAGRRYGQPPTESDVLLAWTWVQDEFLQDIGQRR